MLKSIVTWTYVNLIVSLNNGFESAIVMCDWRCYTCTWDWHNIERHVYIAAIFSTPTEPNVLMFGHVVAVCVQITITTATIQPPKQEPLTNIHLLRFNVHGQPILCSNWNICIVVPRSVFYWCVIALLMFSLLTWVDDAVACAIHVNNWSFLRGQFWEHTSTTRACVTVMWFDSTCELWFRMIAKTSLRTQQIISHLLKL